MSFKWAFSGISTFAHLPHKRCLMDPTPFDIAILGAPFDNAVSYRSGMKTTQLYPEW
jgi:agmatinase